MTNYPKFDDQIDDAVDAAIAAGEGSATVDAVMARLAEPVRKQIVADPALRRRIHDALWLHQTIHSAPRPQPSCQFCDNVLAGLRRGKATMRVPQPVWTAATWLVGLAASIAMVFVFWPRSPQPMGAMAHHRPAPPTIDAVESQKTVTAVTQSPDPTTTAPLHEPLRDGGSAYLALVRTTVDVPSANSATTREGPPLGRALRGSTGAIATVGEGIETSVRPIADSAVHAFGFLFREQAGIEEKPST